MTIKSIETHYAGCRFRSRLEARWAVFFDFAEIPWEYEPEGFELQDGRRYLPDFRLTDCGTWIEVKGSSNSIDMSLLKQAAIELPHIDGRGEQGPSLMILGPIPELRADTPLPGVQPVKIWDPGWHSLPNDTCAGFGVYPKNLRPWSMPCGGHKDWVTPCIGDEEPREIIREAYKAARTARFEHGESPTGHRK